MKIKRRTIKEKNKYKIINKIKNVNELLIKTNKKNIKLKKKTEKPGNPKIKIKEKKEKI